MSVPGRQWVADCIAALGDLSSDDEASPSPSVASPPVQSVSQCLQYVPFSLSVLPRFLPLLQASGSLLSSWLATFPVRSGLGEACFIPWPASGSATESSRHRAEVLCTAPMERACRPWSCTQAHNQVQLYLEEWEKWHAVPHLRYTLVTWNHPGTFAFGPGPSTSYTLPRHFPVHHALHPVHHPVHLVHLHAASLLFLAHLAAGCAAGRCRVMHLLHCCCRPAVVLQSRKIHWCSNAPTSLLQQFKGGPKPTTDNTRTSTSPAR